MPITLDKPIVQAVPKDGIIFLVDAVVLNFRALEGVFNWRVETQDGRPVKNGVCELRGIYFVEWYSEGYDSHQQLVEKIAELAGFSGIFAQEELL